MVLTKWQIESIREILDSRVTLVGLNEDLLDHLCCVVEIKMKMGEDFERAVQEAITELAPNGLERIELETLFLLNSTKIIRMKKIMYFIGMLSAMAFATGYLFALLHLKGATILQLSGFLGFGFIFVPLYAANYFKVKIRTALSEKVKIIVGSAAALLTGTASVFKILYLDGANLMLVVGFSLFVFGFLPFQFFTMYKKSIA